MGLHIPTMADSWLSFYRERFRFIPRKKAEMTPIVVEMLPTTIWVEKDILGRAFVVCQHEGMGAFDYAQFNYQYGYTDNRSVHQAAVDLAQRLGAAEPVKVRNRAVEWIDRPSPVSAPQPITSDQSPAMRKAQDGTAPHPKEK